MTAANARPAHRDSTASGGVSKARDAREMLELVALAQDRAGRARAVIVRRLTDIALLPEGQLSPQERRIVDQMLAGLMGHIELDLRIRMAERLARSAEAPPQAVLALAQDVIEVARPLIVASSVLGDTDLIDIVARCGRDHWNAIATRAGLSSTVTDALIGTGEPETALILADNHGARLSAQGYARLVRMSEREPQLQEPLLARPDMTPVLAHTMFWWVSSRLRLGIVGKFSADRRLLREALDDAIGEGLKAFSGDAEVMRALGFVAPVRRFGPSVGEELVATARGGDLREVVRKLCMLSGIRPPLAARIVADRGGEALAVTAKALGLTRKEFLTLALLIDRERDGAPRDPGEVDRLTALFDQAATERADVVLRYWDEIWGADAGTPVAPPPTVSSAPPAAPAPR